MRHTSKHSTGRRQRDASEERGNKPPARANARKREADPVMRPLSELKTTRRCDEVSHTTSGESSTRTDSRKREAHLIQRPLAELKTMRRGVEASASASGCYVPESECPSDLSYDPIADLVVQDILNSSPPTAHELELLEEHESDSLASPNHSEADARDEEDFYRELEQAIPDVATAEQEEGLQGGLTPEAESVDGAHEEDFFRELEREFESELEFVGEAPMECVDVSSSTSEVHVVVEEAEAHDVVASDAANILMESEIELGQAYDGPLVEVVPDGFVDLLVHGDRAIEDYPLDRRPTEQEGAIEDYPLDRRPTEQEGPIEDYPLDRRPTEQEGPIEDYPLDRRPTEQEGAMHVDPRLQQWLDELPSTGGSNQVGSEESRSETVSGESSLDLEQLNHQYQTEDDDSVEEEQMEWYSHPAWFVDTTPCFDHLVVHNWEGGTVTTDLTIVAEEGLTFWDPSVPSLGTDEQRHRRYNDPPFVKRTQPFCRAQDYRDVDVCPPGPRFLYLDPRNLEEDAAPRAFTFRREPYEKDPELTWRKYCLPLARSNQYEADDCVPPIHYEAADLLPPSQYDTAGFFSPNQAEATGFSPPSHYDAAGFFSPNQAEAAGFFSPNQAEAAGFFSPNQAEAAGFFPPSHYDAAGFFPPSHYDAAGFFPPSHYDAAGFFPPSQFDATGLTPSTQDEASSSFPPPQT